MPAAATTPPLDDALLMQRYASGSEDAFAVLYDRHAASTWRFVMRNVRNTAVADDLTQNIWFAVARSAPTYTYRAKFRTWLFTIAHNAVVDHVRSEKSIGLDAPTADQSEDPVDVANELVANSGFGPVRRLESKEQARAFLAAIEQLPMEQREAFLLQVEAGMDLAEIAKATGVSFETAKSRLRYARSKLRDLLMDFA
jgi:RNA polymerase sigma-70 factor (ECF subfamily)